MRRTIKVMAAMALMATMLAASMVPAFAAGQGGGGGATVEEFVCFRSAGDKVKLGTGKVITTPSGNVNVVCTGKRPF